MYTKAVIDHATGTDIVKQFHSITRLYPDDEPGRLTVLYDENAPGRIATNDGSQMYEETYYDAQIQDVVHEETLNPKVESVEDNEELDF